MRWIAAVTEVVVGVGAIFGGYGLLSDAEGLGAKQAWLDGSVFPDYTVPGLFLLVVIGGGMLTAAAITVFLRATRCARRWCDGYRPCAVGSHGDRHDRLARMAATRARRRRS